MPLQRGDKIPALASSLILQERAGSTGKTGCLSSIFQCRIWTTTFIFNANIYNVVLIWWSYATTQRRFLISPWEVPVEDEDQQVTQKNSCWVTCWSRCPSPWIVLLLCNLKDFFFYFFFFVLARMLFKQLVGLPAEVPDCYHFSKVTSCFIVCELCNSCPVKDWDQILLLTNNKRILPLISSRDIIRYCTLSIFHSTVCRKRVAWKKQHIWRAKWKRELLNHCEFSILAMIQNLFS